MALHYVAPRWLPGGNLQTIWAARSARRAHGPRARYRRERWFTPDGDFIDVDWLTQQQMDPQPTSDRPLLVLFHGLEGSSSSHYAQAFAHDAAGRGWHYAVPHFRGCSGEINWAPRAYHSGDFAEVDWILRQFRRQHRGPVYAVGVSLGANALLRWAQELGQQAATVVTALAAVCAPLDLAASGRAMGRGFNLWVYTRMFLASMKPRALAKLAQFPGLFSRANMEAARDLYDFDNIFTAPLHGFRNTEDYWARASAKPHLASIRLPSLVVNPRNDPFVPASCLPVLQDVGPYVNLWQPAHGGHVGFPEGQFPGHVLGLPAQLGAWLSDQAAANLGQEHG